jgi:hypothetical protein
MHFVSFTLKPIECSGANELQLASIERAACMADEAGSVESSKDAEAVTKMLPIE